MSNSRQASNGVFDLDALIAEKKHLPFTFTFADREWTLPHMDDLDVWPLVEAADGGDLAASVAVLETALGGDWVEFRSHPMPRAGMTALFERYVKHSEGTLPGE